MISFSLFDVKCIFGRSWLLFGFSALCAFCNVQVSYAHDLVTEWYQKMEVMNKFGVSYLYEVTNQSSVNEDDSPDDDPYQAALRLVETYQENRRQDQEKEKDRADRKEARAENERRAEDQRRGAEKRREEDNRKANETKDETMYETRRENERVEAGREENGNEDEDRRVENQMEMETRKEQRRKTPDLDQDRAKNLDLSNILRKLHFHDSNLDY